MLVPEVREREREVSRHMAKFAAVECEAKRETVRASWTSSHVASKGGLLFV